MGNTHCTNTNSHKLLLEKLELKLQKTSCNIEKEILMEYTKIKQGIYKKRYNPKLNNECEKCLVSLTEKNLSSFVPLEKQKNILLNWLEICLNNINDNNTTLIEQIQTNLILFKQYNEYKFKKLVANGSPSSIRNILWMLIANIDIHDNNDISLNELMQTENIEPKIDDQIQKDLYRTYFPNETYTNEQLNQLYNLLKIFAIHNKEIGYCQGMNFIAKFILIISNYNVVNAFHLMMFVFTNIKGYFIDNFPLLTLNLHVFNYYFQRILPKLYQHFKQLEIPNEIWSGKWFQTLFTMCLPFEVTCRVWDSLFAYGFDFIIPFSLSLLKHMESYLLKLNDSFDVIQFFKESLFPQSTIEIYRNHENRIISVDKVIKEAKKIYKNMNKDNFIEIKKEFEMKLHQDEEQLIKENEINVGKTNNTSMSQFDTDFSLCKKDDNNNNINYNSCNNDKKKTISIYKEDNDILIDNELDSVNEIEEHYDEFLFSDNMNIRNLQLHVMSIKRNPISNFSNTFSFIA